MQSKQTVVTTVIRLVTCFALALGAAAQAADKKADPAGIWTWTQAGRNGGPDRTNTLTLKMEGEKLVGMLSAPGRGGGPATETKVDDAKVTGEEITFSTTRETQNGNKIVSKYAGKLEGDTIKGKLTVERDGEVQEPRDWEAKRQAAKTEKM